MWQPPQNFKFGFHVKRLAPKHYFVYFLVKFMIWTKEFNLMQCHDDVLHTNKVFNCAELRPQLWSYTVHARRRSFFSFWHSFQKMIRSFKHYIGHILHTIIVLKLRLFPPGYVCYNAFLHSLLVRSRYFSNHVKHIVMYSDMLSCIMEPWKVFCECFVLCVVGHTKW